MSEFDRKPLCELADCRMGETILSKDLDGTGYPIFSADSSAGAWGHKKQISKILKRGSIVIGARGTIGNPRLPDHDEFGCTQTTIAVTPSSEVDPYYLKLALESSDIKRIAAQQAVPMLTIGQIAQLEIAVPPLPEQKKIAEILSAIDRLIAIANRRMLSELHLRSGLLKEMISEDGAFLKLDSVSTRVSGHTPSKSNAEYWNGGIPWISLSDTAKLDKRYISDTAKEISGQGIQNSSAVLHPAGLVVLSRDARVGCSAITTKKMAVSQHFIGWICSEQLLNRYLYYVLQKWKNKFEAIAMGSTIPTIGVPFFRDLEIPVPPVSEQRKIADTIESVDCHIEELRQRIDCLQNLKSAVASDLLSGRKRVSV